MPYLSASAVVIHYEQALHQVYAPFALKARVSDNLQVSTLATAMQNEMLAVASKYGIVLSRCHGMK